MFSEENPWRTPGLNNYTLNDNLLLIYPAIRRWNSDGFATFHKAKDKELLTGGTNAVFVDGHVGWVRVGLDNIDDGYKYAWPSLAKQTHW